MKKKIKAIVLMLVCVFTLAACGNGEKKPLIEDPHLRLDAEVKNIGALVISGGTDSGQMEAFDRMMSDELEQYTTVFKSYGINADCSVMIKGMKSYASAREDIKDNVLEKVLNDFFASEDYAAFDDYVEAYSQMNGAEIYRIERLIVYDNNYGNGKVFANSQQNGVFDGLFSGDAIEYDVSDDGVIAEVHFKTLDAANGGHDGILEVIFDKNLHVTSITINTVMGLGESMERAGVNTMIGMGTVFIMLILIAIIISLLKYIPKILDLFSGKPEEKTEASLDKTIASIVEREEAQETEDDTELVAVIAAAIAASEGAATTEGFVVRSIRKIR